MTDQKPLKRFVFLLLGDFSQLPLSCAVETLRHANRYSDHNVYDWVLAGEGGEMATASNTIQCALDMGLTDTKRDDVIIVCGGLNIRKNTTQPVVNWLRKEARKGIPIGGMCIPMPGTYIPGCPTGPGWRTKAVPLAPRGSTGPG